MCGIFGFIGSIKISHDAIGKCVESLWRRGPDNSDFIEIENGNEYVLLGHTRLSILDLSMAASQPIEYQGISLAYNGEIYNYVEIRKELVLLGHCFSTTGDAEVFVHALSEWGVKALSKLEGMWAAAWFDKNTRKTFLSRDRFGEKPLFTMHTESGIFFASEIQALKMLSRKAVSISDEKIMGFLRYGYRPLNNYGQTFFHEVTEVQSGSVVVMGSAKDIKSVKYYDANFKPDSSLSYLDCVDLTRKTLVDSLSKQLRSDVPIGFLMSGGIDSNSLISIAAKNLGFDVEAFTVVNSDDRYQEAQNVNRVVDVYNIKHHKITLSELSLANDIVDINSSRSSPMLTISSYLQWHLMKNLSSSGCKVSISGNGADELFTGYYDHHNFYLASQHQGDDEAYARSLRAWETHIGPIVRNPFLREPGIFIKNAGCRDHLFLQSDVLETFFSKPQANKYTESAFCQDLLRNRMLNEVFYETIPVLLREEDANAMYHSVENRTPFLSKDLFELSLTFPTSYLIKDGKTKSILRDAMNGIVPEEILNDRRKVGFNAPLQDVFDFNKKENKEFLLEESPIYSLINRDKIAELISVKGSIPNSLSKFLFSVISCKAFIESNEVI